MPMRIPLGADDEPLRPPPPLPHKSARIDGRDYPVFTDLDGQQWIVDPRADASPRLPERVLLQWIEEPNPTPQRLEALEQQLGKYYLWEIKACYDPSTDEILDEPLPPEVQRQLFAQQLDPDNLSDLGLILEDKRNSINSAHSDQQSATKEAMTHAEARGSIQGSVDCI